MIRTGIKIRIMIKTGAMIRTGIRIWKKLLAADILPTGSFFIWFFSIPGDLAQT